MQQLDFSCNLLYKPIGKITKGLQELLAYFYNFVLTEELLGRYFTMFHEHQHMY